MVHRNRQLVHIFGFVCLLALGGCAGPLLSQDESRSQYDNYDTLRNQRAEQSFFDEYGQRRPDLKARLSPKD